jgi:hypothetical protein
MNFALATGKASFATFACGSVVVERLKAAQDVRDMHYFCSQSVENGTK